jgi:hypothetical protein
MSDRVLSSSGERWCIGDRVLTMSSNDEAGINGEKARRFTSRRNSRRSNS